jgi:hypothetical protein
MSCASAFPITVSEDVEVLVVAPTSDVARSSGG